MPPTWPTADRAAASELADAAIGAAASKLADAAIGAAASGVTANGAAASELAVAAIGAAASKLADAAAAEVSGASALTGLALAASIARVDASELDDHALLEHLADCEKVASWVASLGLAAAAEFARRPARIETTAEDPVAVRARYAKRGQWCREFADAEVMARLGISSAAAGARIRLGCALATMPLVERSLAAGRIDVYKAKVLVAETAVLDSFTARELEPALVALAEGRRVPACDPGSGRWSWTPTRSPLTVGTKPRRPNGGW